MSIESPIYGQRELPDPHKRAWIYRSIIAIVGVCAMVGFLMSMNRGDVLQLDSVASSVGETVQGTPDRPIVGILSLPLTDSFREIHHIHQEGVKAVIPSSYVRWLQSAGAQVVVIPHFWPQEEVRDLVAKLSGVLFTGGDYGDDSWNATTAMIFNEAVRRNGTGDPLALWATCLGYERILQVASDDNHNTVELPSLGRDTAILESACASTGSVFQYTGNAQEGLPGIHCDGGGKRRPPNLGSSISSRKGSF